MKRNIIIATFILLGMVPAVAQNFYDGLYFANNEYYGTARSMGMGNAMTAVGGDLGSIGINPAGSAVATFGQFTITPGVTISSVSSAYSPSGESAYGQPGTTKSTRMTLPNFGFTMNFDTGNRKGIRSFTIGMVANRTNQFENYASAFGTNSMSSKLAEYANAAYGVDERVLEDFDSFDASDVSWDVLTAYQGGMFGSFGADGEYIAVTQGFSNDGSYYFVPGALSQASYVREYGSKTDFMLNLGFNISDKLFVGANLGMPFSNFVNSETFYETAVDPGQFPIEYNGGNTTYRTNFKSASTGYQFISNMDGIYAKLGLIYMVNSKLRLGAAVQTPTMYTVSESWQYTASTSYTDRSFDDSQTSPLGEYTYSMTSPYIVDLGLAYVFGQHGLVSVDYEMADYSVMRVSAWEGDYMSEDPFLDYNMTNKHFAGVSHSLRVGFEYRFNPMFSVRAGYNVTTNPERYWINNEGETVTADDYFYDFDSYLSHMKHLNSYEYYQDRTESVSFGVGYSSEGSFFADFAVKAVKFPPTTYSPYYDYDGYNAAGEWVSFESPKIHNKRELLNAVLTLGWRF